MNDRFVIHDIFDEGGQTGLRRGFALADSTVSRRVVCCCGSLSRVGSGCREGVITSNVDVDGLPSFVLALRNRHGLVFVTAVDRCRVATVVGVCVAVASASSIELKHSRSCQTHSHQTRPSPVDRPDPQEALQGDPSLLLPLPPTLLH